MNENPFASTEPVQEDDWEKRSRLEVKILSDIAHAHIDELLSEEEYKQFGLDKVHPLEIKNFEWSVYVKEYKGRKKVGYKILSEDGLYDVREFDAEDQSVPVSTKQESIDEIASQRSKTSQERKEKAKRELRERMEKERGFSEGKYTLSVTYPHRSDATKTMVVHDITVRTADSRETVLSQAKDWIEMTGLHNFGLDSSKENKETGIRIQAVLKKEGAEVLFECSIDSSGHLVRE